MVKKGTPYHKPEYVVMPSAPFQKSNVNTAPAAFSGDVAKVRRNARVHDPSTIIRCGAFYYVFATGQGVTSWRSRDLVK